MLTTYYVTSKAGAEIAGRPSPGAGRLITLRSDDVRTQDALRRGEIQRPGVYTGQDANARHGATSAEAAPVPEAPSIQPRARPSKKRGR
jgi:hypothetical protein